MGKIKKTLGLFKRKEIWHIDKQVRGKRICESTGESELALAEEYLAFRVNEIRQASIYGVRPKRTFREAATKHLNESRKISLKDDALQLRLLDPYIGDLALDCIHIGSLQPFINDRLDQGLKTRTVNYALQVTRHILNLAAEEWRDENGLTWLQIAPKIKLLKQDDARKPYPLNWEEQSRLFKELPSHLEKMALYKVNTGCREQEVCQLKWEWEVKIPELTTSAFIIPDLAVKNGEERLVILNKVAKSVIDDQRGIHPQYVFTYRGKPIKSINNTAWQSARMRANLRHVRIHDIKHTFGRRLRAAGVSYEDRQDLLGHKSVRMTTHYSSAEIGNLIHAANKVCGENSRNSPALTLIKRLVTK